MTDDRAELWGGAEAYEQYMGRWSRRIAPLFLEWLTAPAAGAWIDVGCGTGVLSSSILARCEPERVMGVDRSEKFVDVARSHIQDPRFRCQVGDAEALPGAGGEFDAVVSGLVLNFVPDSRRAVAEMMRVCRPGGFVALYVWDYAGHMQIMRHFFDAATAVDHGARRFDDGFNAPVCRPEPLAHLFEESGLGQVAVTALDVPAAFKDFDDYWTPFLGGTGSAPKYCASLSQSDRERLRESLRCRVPTGPDGEILLAVRAWAVKGTVAAARS